MNANINRDGAEMVAVFLFAYSAMEAMDEKRLNILKEGTEMVESSISCQQNIQSGFFFFNVQ